MNLFFVETSVIIDYINGKEYARELLRFVDGRLVSSYFCLAELYEGISRVNNPKIHEEPALSFFKNLSEVYGLDMHIAQKFGEIRALLKREGNVIEDIDIFIAATCIVNDCTLLTHNTKHFSRVPGLRLYSRVLE